MRRTSRHRRNQTNGPLRTKAEMAGASMASSMSTYPSDASVLSSVSSKATSPTDFDTSREATHLSSQGPTTNLKSRLKYKTRPKASIPTDISLQEYARQCIAAAESSRLNPFSLHPEEYSLLRAHLSYSQVTTYLNIRNGILRLWSRNPLIVVSRDEAVGCAKDIRWLDVANICYEWLVRRGYINYGCLGNIDIRYHSRGSCPVKRKRKKVVVIGAGMSGLGCARQLEGLFAQFEDRFREQGEEPPEVIVLEGRDRIGGRVYSRGLTTQPKPLSQIKPGVRCTAEMGGMIITGFDRGNPLNIIVRGQLALSYHALKPTTTLYDSNGETVNFHRDQLAEKLYNDVLDRVSDFKFRILQPVSVEGEKDLLETGRDASGEGQRTMSAIEDSEFPPETILVSEPILTPSAARSSEIGSIPVSSDRLTGRAHVELGVPAVHTAAYKARLMGLPVKEGIDDQPDLDLMPSVTSKGATLGSVMDEAIRQYADVVHILPIDLRLVNWHIANLEYSNAINYSQLSLGGWDVDAGNEWEGKHTMVIGGYQQVPRGLLHCPQPLNVRKKSIVKRISYRIGDLTGPSSVECEDGCIIDADYIVSTIPLGVLKQKQINFEPALPDWKTGAIERLGFGILNKVILAYEEPFWDQSRDIFGVLRDPVHRASLSQRDYSLNRGRFFQWFNCTKTSGVPTLVALMAGDAAFSTEQSQNWSLISEATAILRSVFGPKVPEPKEAIITRWGQDRFARGSYSYTGPDFRPDDYEVMARPIGNLFFAGEHTCGTHPATVHGAYISGLRVASEVLDSMIGPIRVPEPLILPKETALKRKSSDLALQEPKDPKQARLEAYETEVWNAIYTKIGDRPWPPAKISANPYILYGKDMFEVARKKCEEGRRPGKGKPAPNEVRIMLSKMWKDAPEAEKKPYNERAAIQKQAYTTALAEYTTKAKKWDEDYLTFRKEYETAHPSVPGPDEKGECPDTPSRRDRKARKCSGYAEDSSSDLEA
jgi:hypothetical protein